MVQHHDEWGKTPPHVGGPWVWAPWQHRPTFMLAGAGTPCHSQEDEGRESPT